MATKRTRDKPIKTRQKWTENEVKLVLEKMKETVKSGKQIEVPITSKVWNSLVNTSHPL